MANIAYTRQQLGLYLKEFRISSYDPSLKTQAQLGNALGLTQKQVSLIECGLAEAPIQLAANWCKLTDWFEGCDLLSYTYGLDPFGFVPVDPSLNQNVSESLHNLRRQLQQALDAVEELIDDEPEAKRAIRHGTYQLTPDTIHYKKEVADVIPAVKSFFYSVEREKRAEMRDIGRIWNQEALNEHVAMPKAEQLERVALTAAR